MASGRDVASSEIGHGEDAGLLGDARRIPDLPSMREFALGAMADRLTVRSDRAHRGGRDPGLSEERERGLGEAATHPCVEFAQFLEAGGRATAGDER